MADNSPSRPIIVAIAGGSATGKSTLARALAAAIPDLSPLVLNQDRYFRDFAELSPDEKEKARTANHPNAINWPAYHDALALLSAGLPIVEPAPGTRARERGEEPHAVMPGRVVIIEGLFALYDEPTRAAASIRVFTEVDDDERVLRRIYRDITERGGNLEGVISWFRRDVMPNFPIYTKSTRVFADVVVPTDRPVDPAVRILTAAIRSHL